MRLYPEPRRDPLDATRSRTGRLDSHVGGGGGLGLVNSRHGPVVRDIGGIGQQDLPGPTICYLTGWAACRLRAGASGGHRLRAGCQVAALRSGTLVVVVLSRTRMGTEIIHQALSKIKRVELRSVWPNEARYFTPWLAKHIAELGEALGIRLETQERESPVGGRSLDIMATDRGAGELLDTLSVCGDLVPEGSSGDLFGAIDSEGLSSGSARSLRSGRDSAPERVFVVVVLSTVLDARWHVWALRLFTRLSQRSRELSSCARIVWPNEAQRRDFTHRGWQTWRTHCRARRSPRNPPTPLETQERESPVGGKPFSRHNGH